MSIYNKLVAYTKSLACDGCYGLGGVDDAEPGDIAFRKWKCKRCKGTGIDPNHHDVPPIIKDMRTILKGES